MAEHAYRTDNPEILAAYRQARADAKAQGKKIHDALEALGVNSRQVFVTSSGFSGDRQRIRDLVPVNGFVPEGWRLVKSTGRLAPRRGKPGEPARQWLAEHQPVDVRHVMESHGLPRAAWIPGTGFNYRIVYPTLFEHDGALWAKYPAEPGTADTGFDDRACMWDPCKLSEFYAAYEAREEVSD